MPLAPWRSPLSRALHRNRALPNARYVQLATVRPDGTPANRTVVFRGFANNRDELQFVSDRRSEKVSHLQHQAVAELCWYFPKTREQFRILGQMVIINAETLDEALQSIRRDLWQALSDNARLQFAWPSPGQPRTENSVFETTPPEPDRPLPNFCGLLLNPSKIDHLELRGEPQNRSIYEFEPGTGWRQWAINP